MYTLKMLTLHIRYPAQKFISFLTPVVTHSKTNHRYMVGARQVHTAHLIIFSSLREQIQLWYTVFCQSTGVQPQLMMSSLSIYFCFMCSILIAEVADSSPNDSDISTDVIKVCWRMRGGGGGEWSQRTPMHTVLCMHCTALHCSSF